MHARASPIISAEAVAVVRRGLRSEFWPARLPTVPKTRPYAACASARNGRLITGLTAVTPSSTTRMPRPSTQPPRGTSANRPSAMAVAPTAIATTPSSSRRRIDDSGSAMSSRSAWTGAIRVVRRAGSHAAAMVTTTPTT